MGALLVQQVSTHSSAAATSLNNVFATAPTSGNLLIVVCSIRNTASGGVTPPSGWTAGPENASNSQDTIAYYKVSDGTETTTTWSWSSAVATVNGSEWSGVDSATLRSAGGAYSYGTSVTLNSAAAVNDFTLFAVGIRNYKSSATWTGGLDGSYLCNTSSGVEIAVGYDYTSSASQSSTCTLNVSDKGAWITLSFPLAAAPAVNGTATPSAVAPAVALSAPGAGGALIALYQGD